MPSEFTLPQLDGRVLSTLNADGSRRWMEPREARGRFHRRRRTVAWALIAVFTLLHDRMAPGCVIVFDEFFGYNGFRQHEYRAFHEFIRETGREFRFVSYSGSQAAAVLDT